MKALGYTKAHRLSGFDIQEITIPEPVLRPTDVLVQVKAVSANPVDYKIRQSRSAQEGRPVILGWDASGIVKQIGSQVTGLREGDEVYYAGDLFRDGSYAELQAVDHRIVAKKPRGISFGDAASLPLTALTAWEALFERGFSFTPETKVLIIGGAGGVGSVAIQLLKARTAARVIATASREQTREWCLAMGADDVIDHRNDLADELAKIGVASVDLVFGTTHSEKYTTVIPRILRPFGSFCLIDDPESLDIVPFKSKAISVHWELMFAKTMNDFNLSSQGAILTEVARLVEERRIRTTVGLTLRGLRADNVKKAHELLESSRSIGKVVIDFKE